MDIFLGILVVLFGLCVGSFLNCLLYRLEIGESFLKGRSYCPACKHPLGWLDLIPVISFLWLGGKCRYCKAKISWQYPLVEIITAAIFLFIWYVQFASYSLQSVISLFFSWYLAASFIGIFVYDLRHFIIPDKLLFPAIAATVVYQAATNYQYLFFNSLWAGLGAFTFFLAIFLLSRGLWMGFGDVKLAFLLGLILGFPNIVTGLFLAFLFGAIIGVALLMLQKKGLKSEVPFAPFLIAGTFVAMFWGQELLRWYSSLLVF